ncbi:MAG TPA: RagB/SusD family nutrient uptake outer membrane protein, partial [Parafilimonas sp.]|nr:RagB/SusD family nutrient uptake outer membrane protein [Parafilimonas sp.]
MKTYIKWTFLTVLAATVFVACNKDLDREPLTGTTAQDVYNTPANYKAVLAKIYAGLAVSGQQGPAGNPDITGYDEGFSNYLRQYWQMEELTTDEAVIGWGDADIQDLHNMNWTTSNTFVRMIYNRLYYQISLCNEFIRESSDDVVAGKGFSSTDADNIKQYRAEARFMRALSYWHAMDLFGNVPFVTENDPVGSFIPPQISRDSLFQYVESELLDVEQTLAEPRTNEYARADKAADWMVLAKLYLNAEVYTGTARYADCINYCNKI